MFLFCVHETWSLTLRQEHRLRVLENKPMKILGPKKGEKRGRCREVRKKKLHCVYFSPNIITFDDQRGGAILVEHVRMATPSR